MSLAKAFDVAFVRFGVPDLGKMRRFLTDFGMSEVPFAPDRLFMRGYEGAAFAHACERRETHAFLGFGIWLHSEEELRALAEHEGADVEPFDAPGGGSVVRLTDPDGFTVEAIAGQSPSEPLPSPVTVPWNHGGEYPRRSANRRIARGPSHVRRLGHVVLGVTDFARSEAWYKERFGFVTSDEIQVGPNVPIGAFLRADRGDEPSDHHTLFLMQRPIPAGFMHAAYEVRDLDDLMAGHDLLAARGYDHVWGIGRHTLGSQVFDYWLDPYRQEIEHWTDGDQLVASDAGGVADLDVLFGVQWGMAMPPLPAMPPLASASEPAK